MLMMLKRKTNRKKDHTPSDGYKRNTKGSLINRQATIGTKETKGKKLSIANYLNILN